MIWSNHFERYTNEPRHEISKKVVCAANKGSDQLAHIHSLFRAFANRMDIQKTFKLLTEQHLELLSLTGGCTGSSESMNVKMPHCWKSHVAAQMYVKLCVHMCLSV